MIRGAASKVMWVGRATVFLVGLAVILALLLGVASMALGATGGNFILGKDRNTATTPTGLISTLADATKSALIVNNKSGGAALDLRVVDGASPIKVSETAGKATNLDADKLDGKNSSDFLQNAGQTTFSVSGPWVSGDPSVVKVEPGFGTTHFTNTSPGSVQRNVQLNPPLPSSLYGKSMFLTGVELCYNTSADGVALGRVTLSRTHSTQAGQSGGEFVVEDSSLTDGNLCEMYSGTPRLMSTNSWAELMLQVEMNANTTFYVQRATFFLEPSNTPAAPQ